MDVSSGDYYRRLRLPRTASPHEIKSAFRRLARQYHPDLHPNQPDAAARFQALREAYEVLSDRIRRQNYDERTARGNGSADGRTDHRAGDSLDYFPQSFSSSFMDAGETSQHSHSYGPQTPTDFYIRGIRHVLAHRYAAALKDYSQAIALDPNFAEAYLRRAEVYYLLENDSGVLADCQQAIALDPTEAKLYYYQGLARYRLGYVQSAIPAFSNAIARDTEDARYYNWRAIAAQDLDDIGEAAQDFRRAAQLYRNQGDIANYRDMQQTLKSLGTAGRRWPYQLFSQLLAFILRPFSHFLGRFSRYFGRYWRFARSARSSSSRAGHRGARASAPNSSSAANSSGLRDGEVLPKGPRTPAQSRPSSAASGPFGTPFQKPYKEQVYWAPGVSSRPVVQDDETYKRPMLGVVTSIKLLSNPAGELLRVYEQLPRGKRGVVGYALAVLANLCFVFGATQYFTDSSWLLASCLWASGGLMFVAMVLVISVVRVWMRIQGLWTADIFMLGTTMVPLGLLTIVAGLIPALTESLAAPWGNAVMVATLPMVVFWAFSQAVVALHNGLYHIHQFSVQTSAWLSPVILGLGIAAGISTWYFLSTNLFTMSVVAV